MLFISSVNKRGAWGYICCFFAFLLKEGPCCLPAPVGIRFHECLLGRGQLCRDKVSKVILKIALKREVVRSTVGKIHPIVYLPEYGKRPSTKQEYSWACSLFNHIKSCSGLMMSSVRWSQQCWRREGQNWKAGAISKQDSSSFCNAQTWRLHKLH